MISIQVPHFLNHHPLPAYSPMSNPGFLNGMSAITKPAPMQFVSNSEIKSKSITPGAKRRPSRAGTRSVATLTAAQLERKRANDREAQRAIRQRTKDHIDSLERRIAELTSTSDVNARLAQALQRNEELEQENKVLRNRLNSAVAAMTEGQPISPEMLTGPASPTRRLRITTRSSSVPNVPRSVPNSATLPMHDQWNQTFSPVTTAVDRSPSLADVSPVSTTLRWGHHHPHQSPVMSDPGVSAQQVDHNSVAQPSPVTYNYIVDTGERPMSYSPAADPSMMQPYPTPATSESVNGYCQSPHSAPQMNSTIPSPAYAQFPGTPQSYMATSPHDSDPNMQMMPPQRSQVEAQTMMYSMHASIKDE